MEEIEKFIQKSREVSWWEVEDMEEMGGGGEEGARSRL